MVNGEQIIVQFHVDDLKVSHKEQSVLDDFLSNLRREFGQEDELIEHTGLVHKYLSITVLIRSTHQGSIQNATQSNHLL